MVDVEGAQIADFFSWTVGGLRNQDMSLSAMVASRWKLGVGDVLVDTAVSPVWTIVDDTAGSHFFGGGCCTREVNTWSGVEQDGCVEIVRRGTADLGITPEPAEQAAAANLFAARAYLPDGTVRSGRPWSLAGDSITFRAETSMWWMVVCCPFQAQEVCGPGSTPHRVEVLVPGR